MFGLGTTPPRIATVLRDAVGSFLSTYRTNNVTPELVADFNGSLNKGVEGYAAGKDVDTFAELITHSRAGNATMTDGYGPELVTNGTFNNSDGWSTGAGWEISNGQATRITGAYSELLYTFPSALQAGKTYTIEFTAPISGTMAIGFIGPNVTSAYATRSGATAITLTATGSHTGLRFLPGGPATDGAIDNVSVREIPAIKWAPHNLLTYSEDLSNAAWTKFNISVSTSTGVAPDGNNTANKITETNTNGIHGFRSNAIPETINSFSVFAKEAERRYCVITLGGNNTPIHGGGITVDLRDGSVLSSVGTELLNYSVLDAGNGWYQLSITTEGTGIGGSNFPFVWIADNSGHVPGVSYGADGYQGDGVSGIYLWGVHAFRSDLGGMVDNPETGDSYVPTTSSAVYLPRRNHHVYNGSAWVNEGVLHESEARTNLATYSEDFSQWIRTPVTATPTVEATGPDGITSATKLGDSGVGGTGGIYITYNATVSPSTTYTYSVFAKAGQLSDILLYQNSFTSPANNGYYFDLLNGTFSAYSGTPPITPTMEDVGNGWYRCSITFTTDAVDTSGNLQIYVADGTVYTLPLDGTSNILIYGFQLEAGSTPSCYIPTNGSTVSRALETLTIPAANMPWPEPNYIGPELVVNGDFSTDSNWVKGAGWSISNSTASHIAGTGSNLVQAVSLTTGKLYRASCDVVSCSGGSGSIQFRDGGTTTPTTINSVNVGQTVEVLYIAEGNLNVSITAGSLTNLVVDNISVREIDPLSVSIQTQGRMTWADLNISVDQTMFQWGSPFGSDFIRAYMDTGGSLTGMVVFQSRANGVDDFSASGVDDYSPGLLVPYNISSRHGSTFVNGAIDGVALTANTTPLALPDLSATDFNLGYNYMGTISMLRVWADDLADVGIVEASEPSEVPSLQLTFDNSETSFTVQDWEQ